MNMRLWMSGILLIAAASLAAGESAFAEADAIKKLERGAINTTTGWLELFVQPVEGSHSDQPFKGTVMGAGKGLLLGIQRTGYGVSDALSFPAGPYDRPTMEKETVFGDAP